MQISKLLAAQSADFQQSFAEALSSVIEVLGDLDLDIPGLTQVERKIGRTWKEAGETEAFVTITDLVLSIEFELQPEREK